MRLSRALVLFIIRLRLKLASLLIGKHTLCKNTTLGLNGAAITYVPDKIMWIERCTFYGGRT